MESFKFPDEVEKEKPVEEKLEIEIEGDTEIEVVDDTPEADRGRKPMKEAPAEVTDDELAQYSEGVKKRIQHFSKGYHEERRAKEAALREREEAVRLAQNLVEENKRLQGSLGQGQQALLEQAKKVVQNELDQAKQRLKAAHEAFDTDAIVEAVNNFKPAVAQPQNNVVQPAPRPEQTVRVDSKAKAWQDANSWFGADKEMTALALAVHQDLVESGEDTNSDEYYEKINARVRKRFPEAFTSEKRKSSVVAPATRSTAPRKIVLTQSQVQIAKRLGVPLEAYAKQVAEEMRKQNG
jgi:hypothetical protein